jgi:hypothetical protein
MLHHLKIQTVSLVNGSNGSAATASEINLAYDKFKNSERRMTSHSY